MSNAQAIDGRGAASESGSPLSSVTFPMPPAAERIAFVFLPGTDDLTVIDLAYPPEWVCMESVCEEAAENGEADVCAAISAIDRHRFGS